MLMTATRAKHPARPGERGEVSWVGLALLLALAAGAYLAWVWVPVYWLHQEVERVVRETGNAAVKNRDDAALVAQMTQRLRALESVEATLPDGREGRLPVVNVWPEDVAWERDGDRLRVAFAYVREVTYPYLDRSQERVLEIDLTLDVARPNWGNR
jgi:hypothetical protein